MRLMLSALLTAALLVAAPGAVRADDFEALDQAWELYFEGRLAESRSILLELAEAGDTTAMVVIGQNMLPNHLPPEPVGHRLFEWDYEGGMAWLTKAAELGDPLAIRLLVKSYLGMLIWIDVLSLEQKDIIARHDQEQALFYLQQGLDTATPIDLAGTLPDLAFELREGLSVNEWSFLRAAAQVRIAKALSLLDFPELALLHTWPNQIYLLFMPNDVQPLSWDDWKITQESYEIFLSSPRLPTTDSAGRELACDDASFETSTREVPPAMHQAICMQMLITAHIDAMLAQEERLIAMRKRSSLANGRADEIEAELDAWLLEHTDWYVAPD